jgi:hypothetical protein
MNALPAQFKTNISAVLKKSRNCIPARLRQEFPNDV